MALGAGCVGTTVPDSSGNAGLGIAEFQVTDTAELTTIIGRDADGAQVAKLDLIHGHFISGDEYGGQEIDGRKLDVDVHGQSTMWETIGYSDTTHMPALPSSLSAVAAFVADDHVRPILARWNVGWRNAPGAAPQAPGSEVAYDYSYLYGYVTNPQNCSGYDSVTTCPNGFGGSFTYQVCLGAVNWEASVGHVSYSSYNEDLLFECLPRAPSNDERKNVLRE